MPSTARDLRIKAHAAGVKTGRSIARHRHRLDPSNLAHRIKPNEIRQHTCSQAFERARCLSLQIDHELDGPALNRRLNQYTYCVQVLREHRHQGYLDKLIRLEAARGVVRAKFTH